MKGGDQGRTPMSARTRRARLSVCRITWSTTAIPQWSAKRSSASPLRYGTALASCRTGGHEIWWSVTAENEAAAFYLLPTFVSGTSTATSFDEVRVP
jgi:hypothetical protein